METKKHLYYKEFAGWKLCSRHIMRIGGRGDPGTQNVSHNVCPLET